LEFSAWRQNHGREVGEFIEHVGGGETWGSERFVLEMALLKKTERGG